jgi:hypothetical protein
LRGSLLSAHKTFRFLAFTFLAVFLLLLVMQAKNYYLAPVYPVLFAAGAVAFEQLTTSRHRWFRGAYIALTAAAGLVLAPFCLPMLPLHSFLSYQQAFRGSTPIRFELQRSGPLPQQFAD